MASRQRWLEFLSSHSAQHPGGVIDRMFTDWRKAKANADSVSARRHLPPSQGHNSDSPGRIAQMLADRIRRGR